MFRTGYASRTSPVLPRRSGMNLIMPTRHANPPLCRTVLVTGLTPVVCTSRGGRSSPAGSRTLWCVSDGHEMYVVCRTGPREAPTVVHYTPEGTAATTPGTATADDGFAGAARKNLRDYRTFLIANYKAEESLFCSNVLRGKDAAADITQCRTANRTSLRQCSTVDTSARQCPVTDTQARTMKRARDDVTSSASWSVGDGDVR
jgi:hypothetical protein